jgi:hypothetical protein
MSSSRQAQGHTVKGQGGFVAMFGNGLEASQGRDSLIDGYESMTGVHTDQIHIKYLVLPSSCEGPTCKAVKARRGNLSRSDGSSGMFLFPYGSPQIFPRYTRDGRRTSTDKRRIIKKM